MNGSRRRWMGAARVCKPWLHQQSIRSTPILATGPERDGPELIEGTRSLYGETIGGFCQLTTVARDEISMRILKRWPEHVTLPFNTAPVP